MLELVGLVLQEQQLVLKDQMVEQLLGLQELCFCHQVVHCFHLFRLKGLEELVVKLVQELVVEVRPVEMVVEQQELQVQNLHACLEMLVAH